MASGDFAMLFNGGIIGLDFIGQIGVEVKAKGFVSNLFADGSVDESRDQV